MQWIKAFGILTIVCGCIDIGFARIIDTDSFNQLRTSQSQTIPSDYFLFETSYYKYYNNGQTWEAAQETCEKDGGHLVIINSEDEASILMLLMNSNSSSFVSCVDGYIHIGLKKRKNPQQEDDEGEWITIDGQSLKNSGYDKWAPGEPNNWANMEDCGTFYRLGGLNDFPCWCTNPFVCEIPLKERTDQLSQNSDFHDWVEIDGDYKGYEYDPFADIEEQQENNNRNLLPMPQTVDWRKDVQDYEDFASEITTETQEELVTDWSTTGGNHENFSPEMQNESEKNKYYLRVRGDSFAQTSTETQEEPVTDWSTTNEIPVENFLAELQKESEKNKYFHRVRPLAKTSTKIREESENYADSFTDTSTEAPEEMEEYEYNGGDLGESITEAPAKTTEELNNTNYFGGDLEDSFTETSTEAQEEPGNMKSLEQKLRDWSIIEDVVAETTTEHQKEPQEKKNWITMVSDNLILYFPTESSSIKIFDVNKDFRGLSLSCKNCSYMMSFYN
ncbi:uncharacterized protein LOC123290874 [Chrysoperla carnea]|uniref:uncharacterized protein LOC123290874 n=1 Tax=Chrysoperla carnea TaxID=189513 RepID=UPI001D07E498|nr:uncharacterized protein LOC123290874 [Chrysoperla carnea]